ncbi:TPA: DUF4435 domain-containing protein [Vibrio vulnificus]|nr:DUF4435 domain-containing protein [Vibrio vulnificus]
MKISSNYIAATRVFGKDQRETIVVYVESYNDQRLWSNVTRNEVVEAKKLKILFKVPTLDNEANGKTSLINSFKAGRIVPGKNLVLCLDSDFDYIVGYSNTSPKCELYNSDFVFQTYAHSAENHYFTAGGLNHLCEMAVCSSLHFDFCIEHYTEEWSKALYSIYTRVLYLRSIGNHESFKEHMAKINEIIENIYSGKLNAKKLSVLLTRMKTAFDSHQAVMDSKFLFEDSYNDFLAKLSEKGMTQKNTHYFYRGHDLENRFLSNICTSICNCIIAEQRSNIYRTTIKNAQQQVEEYQNNIKDVISSIKQRTEFPRNPLFDKMCADFGAMCESYF